MPEEYKGCGCVGGVTFNNTTLIEVNGFYFDPVVVPPDFCQSASPNSNTPWKLGRGKLEFLNLSLLYLVVAEVNEIQIDINRGV